MNFQHLLAPVFLMASAWLHAASGASDGSGTPPPAVAPEDESYVFEVQSGDLLNRERPTLPDLSRFSAQQVEAHLRQRPDAPGIVRIERMVGIPALDDFLEGEQAREWVIRQFSFPKAIVIKAGRATLEDVYRQINNGRVMERLAEGVYLARLPIAIMQGATLVIRGETLRLSEERGAFLASDGGFFLINGRLEGWREAANGPATYQASEAFRPFYTGWGGSETFVHGSELAHLGYNMTKSYGFSVAQYSEDDNAILQRSAPTGWLIESGFTDLYFGFYSSQAEDVAIINNLYRNSIANGIDPHDHSQRLIIAGNEVRGTRENHGIFISGQVNGSWIFGNRSHHNGRSGIVLARQSSGNVVADNVVSDNQGDGIGLYESPDNLLWGNRLIKNQSNGIRVRNSTDVLLYRNVALLNGTYGIFGQLKDLSDTDRDFAEDAYRFAVSMTVVGGKLAANASGPLASDNPQYLSLFDVEMRFPGTEGGIQFDGALGIHQSAILDALINQQQAVTLRPAPRVSLN
ncbi:NosD domain-containing protein [Marinobacter sp. F4218]|uniref:NosD domain-containing protein n=1 Tax=Marinobacter sp. F4218 TaxID=2862868 RepID=UPI001C628545|nr:right-handed parallel beta-helix repeat-containing protein [Marinobacter sp. F4218]MBW7470397.1 right-handed parallel beta-helix repeat-containing protein [Marinobacter sp. F4218]